MIPDLQSSLLCDDVRQERNGKFMLIGIFEGLALPAKQPVCPRICLVNRWCMGEGTFTQKTRIIAPDEVTPVAEGQSVEITLPDTKRMATTVEMFINIPFKQEWTHWVEVSLDQKMRMRYPLHVKQVEPQQQQHPPQ